MKRFIKSIIKRIIYPLFGLSIPNRELNIYKTIVFNYLAFGIKGLVKFPVYVFSHTNIYKVGIINIHCEMQRGLIRIGQLDYKSQGVTKFLNNGIIDVYGPVEIGGASIIENSGIITLRGYNRIPDGCQLFIREGFEMGEQSRLGFHSCAMDSDDHYTIDEESLTVHRNTKPIVIGGYNWIANSSFIKKGVKTPDYLIVASANALLTKDYTSLPPYSVIGGCPAKLIKSGIRRIYNENEEREIKSFFKSHTSDMFLKVQLDGKTLDEYCSMSHFG